MSEIIPALVASILVVAAAPAQATPTSAPAHTATIDLVEAGKTVAFTVALLDDGSMSTLRTRCADGLYEIKVRRDAARTKAGAPVLEVELSRHDERGPTISMRATTSAALGRRAILLQVDRGDGTRYEVGATVH